MRRRGAIRGRNLRARRNHDRLCHAVVEGNDDVIAAAIFTRHAKRADDGGVAALENLDDAALLAAIGFGRFELNQNLVALHGGVDFTGRNEDVLPGRGDL